jgi:hypothetical protein
MREKKIKTKILNFLPVDLGPMTSKITNSKINSLFFNLENVVETLSDNLKRVEIVFFSIISVELVR